LRVLMILLLSSVLLGLTETSPLYEWRGRTWSAVFAWADSVVHWKWRPQPGVSVPRPWSVGWVDVTRELLFAAGAVVSAYMVCSLWISCTSRRRRSRGPTRRAVALLCVAWIAILGLMELPSARVPFLLGCWAIPYVGYWLYPDSLGMTDVLCTGLAIGRSAAAALVALGLVAVWWLRARGRRARDDDTRGCVHCGYDLYGNISGRCPECGRDCGAPSGLPAGAALTGSDGAAARPITGSDESSAGGHGPPYDVAARSADRTGPRM